MALLVDEARWWWRGRRWAHLISDVSLEELHRFAAGLGLHRVSFGGDHYDVTEPQRLAALAAGAEAIGSRELLRRLQGAGLRRSAGSGSHRWEPVAATRWDPSGAPPLLADTALAAETGWLPTAPDGRWLACLAASWAQLPFELRVLRNGGELALLLADPHPERSDDQVAAIQLPPWSAPVQHCWVTVPRASRLLEVFIRLPDVPKMTGEVARVAARDDDCAT